MNNLHCAIGIIHYTPDQKFFEGRDHIKIMFVPKGGLAK